MKKYGPTLKTFLDEFPKFLEDVLLLRNNLVITGDFINIHFEDSECTQTMLFRELLNSVNFVTYLSLLITVVTL